MAKKNVRKELADKEKWNKIFNALVQMLKTQQTQLETLVNERKLLEDRIILVHERWASDVNLLKDQVSQMKRKFTAQEMELEVEAAKSDLLLGLKQREASLCRHKLENVDNELADFRDWFDILSRKLTEHEDTSKATNEKGGDRRLKALESEVKRLKCEIEKLNFEKNTEVTALLAEKKFVWNQYNKMESKWKEQLQEKSAEVECANKKINMIMSDMKELQSSISEKDNAVLRLKGDLGKMEADSLKKSEEIVKLSRELELLKRPRSDSATPFLRHCTAGRGKNGAVDGKVVTVKKESNSQPHAKGCRNSKRKATEVITISDTPKLYSSSQGCRNSKRKALKDITISDTPKLFSSAFKVPKLKSSGSSRVV